MPGKLIREILSGAKGGIKQVHPPYLLLTAYCFLLSTFYFLLSTYYFLPTTNLFYLLTYLPGQPAALRFTLRREPLRRRAHPARLVAPGL